MWCPRRESNSHFALRTGQFYPLNYEGCYGLILLRRLCPPEVDPPLAETTGAHVAYSVSRIARRCK